jgi:hypothetical protein
MSKINHLFKTLNSFRINHLFILPSEAKRAMIAHRNAVYIELGKRRDEFKLAIAQMVNAKISTRRMIYTLEFKVDAAAMETSAGENQAAAAMGANLAEMILARHKRQKQNALAG